MAVKAAAAVWETSSTTGTGTFNLNGAEPGFRTFVDGVGTGSLCPYQARLRGGTVWEDGIGTVTDASPDTLARTTVMRSSAGAKTAANFAGGIVDIFLGPNIGHGHVYQDAAVPGVNDDLDGGFLPGSQWVDTDNDQTWQCKDNSNGAAVWHLTSPNPAFKSNTDQATITFDLSARLKHTVTIGDNRTLALSNGWDGAIFIIELVQDDTGSRTVTWFSTIIWEAGSAPTLTTTNDKKDRFIFEQLTSSTYLGYVLHQDY